MLPQLVLQIRAENRLRTLRNGIACHADRESPAKAFDDTALTVHQPLCVFQLIGSTKQVLLISRTQGFPAFRPLVSILE